LRKSKQKDLILEVITSSFNHPTAQEIYNQCRKEIKNISLGTIYRDLNILVNGGKIKLIKMPNNVNRYDRLVKHAHFICLNCYKIEDINDFMVESVMVKGCKVLDYEVSFKGICYECLKKEGEC